MVFSLIDGAEFAWNDGGEGGLLKVGGETAKKDDIWLNSWAGDWEIMGDVEDIEDDKDEIDWVYTVSDGLWGIDGLDTVLYQSALSPDGLFQSVEQTSLSMLYAFEPFRDLCR